MIEEALTTLAEQYPPQSRDAVVALAEKFRIRNEREVLELAALAAGIGLDDIVNLGLEPDVNPQLMEALDTYPTIKESLLDTGELNPGQINNIKGKYFETLVRDRLNDGEALGELQLEPGQIARLATSPSQKGWDLEIIDENGESVELLQLKATESTSYVKDALENHPDYRIVVPSEMDSAPDERVGTDISHADLKAEAAEDNVLEQFEEHTEGILENVAEVSTEFALDVVPIGTLGILVTIGGYRFLTGQATLREATYGAGQSLRRAAIWSSIGSGLAAAGLGMGALPATVGLRVAMTRVSAQATLGDGLARRVQELNGLLFPSSASAWGQAADYLNRDDRQGK